MKREGAVILLAAPQARPVRIFYRVRVESAPRGGWKILAGAARQQDDMAGRLVLRPSLLVARCSALVP